MAIVRAAAKNPAVQLHPLDNLELDLGLDSMERVELLVELEHHLGADVEDSAASQVYTVRELIDLVRGNIGKGATQAVGWETLLSAEVTDPEVLAIAKERPITGPLWYLCGRISNLLARDIFRLKIDGIEKLPAKGPFILCANHQSYLDAPVLTAAMPWHIFRDLFYVGDSEKFGAGPARAVARFLRLIPVDPDANLVPAMRAGAYGLRHRKILVLYPEGERSIDGVPRSFKKGAAILAHHLNVPIVPVAQEGFFEAWPRGRSFQRFAPLEISIGDPVYPDPAEAPEAAYNRLTAEVHERIVSMWETCTHNVLRLHRSIFTLPATPPKSIQPCARKPTSFGRRRRDQSPARGGSRGRDVDFLHRPKRRERLPEPARIAHHQYREFFRVNVLLDHPVDIGGSDLFNLPHGTSPNNRAESRRTRTSCARAELFPACRSGRQMNSKLRPWRTSVHPAWEGRT